MSDNQDFDSEQPEGGLSSWGDAMDDTAERVAVRAESRTGRSGSRRAERSRVPGCLAVLVALALIVGGGWLAWGKVTSALDGFGDVPDFAAGQAGDAVTFEVKQGDSVAQIGRNLKAAGITKSVDAFIDAASANPDSAGIQVGFYPMRTRMAASEAVAVLVNPKNIVTTTVAIREGLRLTDIVATLAKKTGIPKADFDAALKNPDSIGLPAYANGNAEGYLFPATYSFPPGANATTILKQMVDRWRQAIGDNDVEDLASKMGCEDDETTGCTAEQVMTIASLVQSEGRGRDMAKIARVIYNRLQNQGTAGTVGLLQIDATVLYALGRDGNTPLLTDEIESTDSPYNTYQHKGLPPGPIGAPGDEAIQAALHPADGDWYYYVTVNLATGETKFASTMSEFSRYKAEYQEYCRTQSDRC